MDTIIRETFTLERFDTLPPGEEWMLAHGANMVGPFGRDDIQHIRRSLGKDATVTIMAI